MEADGPVVVHNPLTKGAGPVGMEETPHDNRHRDVGGGAENQASLLIQICETTKGMTIAQHESNLVSIGGNGSVVVSKVRQPLAGVLAQVPRQRRLL